MRAAFEQLIKPKNDKLGELLGVKKISVTYVPTEDKFIKIAGFSKLMWKPF